VKWVHAMVLLVVLTAGCSRHHTDRLVAGCRQQVQQLQRLQGYRDPLTGQLHGIGLGLNKQQFDADVRSCVNDGGSCAGMARWPFPPARLPIVRGGGATLCD
jgi:hypothetical protein